MFNLFSRKVAPLELGEQHQAAAAMARAFELTAMLREDARHRIKPGHR